VNEDFHLAKLPASELFTVLTHNAVHFVGCIDTRLLQLPADMMAVCEFVRQARVVVAANILLCSARPSEKVCANTDSSVPLCVVCRRLSRLHPQT